jgi:Uma2 family endonuclease
MSTATATRLTAADLQRMPDGDKYELVDGELVERNVSQLSSLVAMEMGSQLRNFCKPQGLAWVFGADAGYRCFPDDPDKVRKPDVSVILAGRLPAERIGAGFSTLAPDLAVEVISPNDLAYDVDEKVEEYLSAGVRLVWVVNPELRTVRVYRPDGSLSLRRAAESLDGEDVLPGFHCPIAELFPAGAATAPAS